MKIVNKTAPNKFSIEEKFEAGISLIGSEVKAIRMGHVDLSGAYVKILTGEAHLINAKIFPYKFSRIEGYQEDRSRKLLLHKSELRNIKLRLDSGKFTLVPLSLYEKKGKFKLEVALAKGKKEFEKRKDSKTRAIERDRNRESKYDY